MACPTKEEYEEALRNKNGCQTLLYSKQNAEKI